jgi:hypothetical protein
LSNNEYEDLKIFGKSIDNKNRQKDLVYKNKTFIKKSRFDIKKILFKVLKISILFLKKLKRWSIKLLRIVIQKYSVFISKRQKKSDIFLKIVETKKQRGNKVILVRKSVPYKYIPEKICYNKPNLNSLYYLSVNAKDDGTINIDKENYTSLKESIWDFQIELKKKKKKR